MNRLDIAVLCTIAASGCTCHKPSDAVQAPVAVVAQAATPASAAVPEVKPATTAPNGPGGVPPDAGAETGDDDAPWPTLREGESSPAEPQKVETPDYGTSCRSWAGYTIDTVMLGEFGEGARIRVFEGQPEGECNERTSSPVFEVDVDDFNCTPQLLLPNFMKVDCGTDVRTSIYIYSIVSGKRVFKELCDLSIVGSDWLDCAFPAEVGHECAENGEPYHEGAFQPAIVKHFDARTGEVTQIDPKVCIYIQ